MQEIADDRGTRPRSFKIEESEWNLFLWLQRRRRTNASAALRGFVSRSVADAIASGELPVKESA
ncbi:hypothetical protein [Streptomyces silvisoli]|uniref:Uncharacterized protein n=1 Tax=Streptomyces silvisoli TaxID=3034235 RepID=A0ABT5ZLN1_9ACTN|nr:hypothetical protein [Streptomyces silvisoli]MDF3290735.1 hypothetical protein [Streptomyces silvisoli]